MSNKSVKDVKMSNIILGDANGDVKNTVNSSYSEYQTKEASDNLMPEPWYKKPFGIISMSIISITVASLLVKWLLS